MDVQDAVGHRLGNGMGISRLERAFIPPNGRRLIELVATGRRSAGIVRRARRLPFGFSGRVARRL